MEGIYLISQFKYDNMLSSITKVVVGQQKEVPVCTQSYPGSPAKMGGIVVSLLSREKFMGHRRQYTSENHQLGLKLGDA